MTDFKRKRGTMKTSITKLLSKIEADLSSEPVNVQLLEITLDQIAKKEVMLQKLDEEVLANTPDPTAYDKEYGAMLDYLDDISKWSTLAKQRIREEQPRTGSRASGSSATSDNGSTRPLAIKLPKLSMGKFNGDPLQWYNFWNQYKTAVHNHPNLDKGDKFTYLLSYLEGAAYKAVKGMPIDDDTYDEAIELLESRFGNKDLIIDKHMNNLLKLDTVRRATDVMALRKLYDSLQVEIRSLKALGVGQETYGTLLRTILKARIPPEIILEFSRTKEGKAASWQVKHLVKYLGTEVENRERAVGFNPPESTGSRDTGYKDAESLRNGKGKPWQGLAKNRVSTASTLTTIVGSKSCFFCTDSGHNANTCGKTTVEQKLEVLRQGSMCFICFGKGHSARGCWEKAKLKFCDSCGRKHHPMLCENRDKSGNEKGDRPSSNERQTRDAKRSVPENTEEKRVMENSVASCSTVTIAKTVYLQTAQATIRGPHGERERLRCLFDNASHRTFIKEDISRRCQLPVIGEEYIDVYPFESNFPTKVKRRIVRVTLENKSDPSRKIEMEALESPNICSALIAIPEVDLAIELRKRGLEVADDQGQGFDGVGDLGVLIGSDHLWGVVTGKVEMLGPKLAAVETIFGWAIQGQNSTHSSTLTVGVNVVSVMTAGVSTEAKLSEQIEAFWKLDSMGIQENGTQSAQELNVLENFNNLIKFNEDRYQVCLPWNEKKDQLGDNYIIARKRTERLRKRFRQDPVFYNQYRAVIQEQESQGVIEVPPVDSNNDNPKYYLPHQAVIRADHDTTKLRVVNDCSSHENGVPSLNDCLSSGPSLSPELLAILLRFRNYKVAFTADIEKAFLQVSLAPQDRDAFRFLWPEDPNKEEFKTYRITRVPFGATSSPFLLSATIHYHLEQNQESKGELCQLIKKSLYLDDLVSGASSDEEAYKTAAEAKDLLRQAGMNLRKWKTNSKALCRRWDTEGFESKSSEDEPIKLEPKEYCKVLGITWNPVKDIFAFDMTAIMDFITNKDCTKRRVLQCVARIFDPIGFLAPFVVRMKIIFQEIWEIGIQWDEVVPEEIKRKFEDWCSELPAIHKLKIPRHYYGGYAHSEIDTKEIHVFCDASELAYAAVAYLRFKKPDGKFEVKFLASKTRVAPLKRLTLPRLELMGAVLGTRLYQYINENLLDNNFSITMWSDSTIALHWIKGKSIKWKPFVANRVQEIQSHTEPRVWRHVSGKSNPADFPTRGMNVEKLISNSAWWEGPSWLHLEKENWPQDPMVALSKEEAEQELRAKYEEIVQGSCVVEPRKNAVLALEKYHSLTRVKRIMAWSQRFIFNSRKPLIKRKGQLTVEELDEAEKVLVRQAQTEDFPEELKKLKKSQPITTNSKLASLNPILDKDGVLRLGGRLEKSTFSYDEKYPYILSGKNRLSELIILFHHSRLMHSGLRDTLAEIRERFWITRGRQVAKTILQRCVVCKRFTVKPGSVNVAPLPRDRITEAPCFQVCGVDFGGPLHVKSGKKNTAKVYIALFTCAVTRGVHLELVTDLSTERFLLALRRFIARRGIPETIYSDNARTFKRADQDLQNIWKNLKSPQIREYFAEKGIKWKNIIERAAWHGGFYERLIKSTKLALKKVLGKALLTHEELETILTEVEAILNSRPLTFTYNEANEPSPLTPGHFYWDRE